MCSEFPFSKINAGELQDFEYHKKPNNSHEKTLFSSKKKLSISKVLTLRVGRGPILVLSSFRLNEGKPSNRNFYNQIIFPLQIHFYVFSFWTFGEKLLKIGERAQFSRIFQKLEGSEAYLQLLK